MSIKLKELSHEELVNISELTNEARGYILQMTTLSASGHPGGSMSTIDFLMTLYNLINVDPKNPNMENRDRVVMSHGHVSPAAYTTLAAKGFFPIEDAVSQFRLAGSIYEGHVEPDVPGIEWASGNLGQGLSAGVGFALANKQKGINSNVFVLMGDGEQQKGQIAEARRFAVKYDLNNITAFIDYNQLQINGDITGVMPQNIMDNYISDGWDVISIDGHNFEDIHNAIHDAVDNENPTVIIAHTTMGKGVSFMENKEKFHGSTLNEEQLVLALEELDVENRFDEMKKLRSEHNEQNNCEHSTVRKALNLDLGSPIIYQDKTDCRSAWGNAIADIAKLNKKAPLAVFDCDLMGSVKTDGFFAELPENFYQAGIMEHHTAVMAGAMSAAGVQSYFADFGVFGVDETFNQHRLSDINNTNLKVITTHVGLDVGEDGKTHQCIDYLGVMKNIFGFHTIVPADPNQTDRIIRYISGKYGNFLVPMGRSKLDAIKDSAGEIFFGENYTFEFGKADKLRSGNDGAILAMGTLVTRALEVASKLAEEGINISVWNFSCPTALDECALAEAAKTGNVFTYEDHNVQTGLGNSIADKMMELGLACKFTKFGVEGYAMSGASDQVFAKCKLDTDSIIKRIKAKL
ncbi:MAG: transketolase [Candidatus Cloacimonetes bacterium]|nr:transketolase [Candidatus Cloacimonadota bacterium]